VLKRIVHRLRAIRNRRVFRRDLVNADEAWAAVHRGARGVPLRFRDGATLTGTAWDDVVGIYFEIFVERCYTPRWFYRPAAGDTVLDVGANVGAFTLFLTRAAPGIRVEAFEPHPVTFATLQTNLTNNAIGTGVTAHNTAVGRGGVVRFARAAGLDSGHQAATADGDGDEVPCVTLEAAASAVPGPIALVKVDTEGAEVEILESAPAGVWARVARVVVEYHTLAKRHAVVRCLSGHGYATHVVPARGYEHHLGLVYAWRG
jgi:FkbM family methyltransferase